MTDEAPRSKDRQISSHPEALPASRALATLGVHTLLVLTCLCMNLWLLYLSIKFLKDKGCVILFSISHILNPFAQYLLGWANEYCFGIDHLH